MGQRKESFSARAKELLQHVRCQKHMEREEKQNSLLGNIKGFSPCRQERERRGGGGEARTKIALAERSPRFHVSKIRTKRFENDRDRGKRKKEEEDEFQGAPDVPLSPHSLKETAAGQTTDIHSLRVGEKDECNAL